jgi:hypothetical protein
LNTHTDEQYTTLDQENIRLRLAIRAMITELREIDRQNDWKLPDQVKSHVYEAIDLGQLVIEDEEFTDGR